MSSKMLSWLIRGGVIVCAAAGVFLSVYGYSAFCAAVTSEIFIFMVLLILLQTVTAPCYVILVFVWVVSIDVARETVFSHRTSILVGASAFIIFAATTILFVGTSIILAIDSTFLLGYLLYVVAAVGFLLGMFAAVLARYVTKAADLEEQSEGTI